MWNLLTAYFRIGLTLPPSDDRGDKSFQKTAPGAHNILSVAPPHHTQSVEGAIKESLKAVSSQFQSATNILLSHRYSADEATSVVVLYAPSQVYKTPHLVRPMVSFRSRKI